MTTMSQARSKVKLVPEITRVMCTNFAGTADMDVFHQQSLGTFTTAHHKKFTSNARSEGILDTVDIKSLHWLMDLINGLGDGDSSESPALTAY